MMTFLNVTYRESELRDAREMLREAKRTDDDASFTAWLRRYVRRCRERLRYAKRSISSRREARVAATSMTIVQVIA